MACATLKRSLDWESLNQRPTKRRRCHPFGSPSSSASNQSSPSAASASSSAMRVMEPKPSPFVDASCPKLTPEKMAQNITEEIRRLHRRKQLTFNSTQHNMERMQDSESSGSEMGPDSPRRPDTPPSMMKNPEKALFTFKQVQMICERMLKEREDSLREQYDAVLNTKLAEQYDAFVKFTYDQIQRRYEAAPSYLS
ncbi:akirin [Toxorhynchites rutilus septentrionalis]|uniref:akirin n=1 Tax=Toxorhynchites rutilus septentrionalis TaxID=329112 RepID=UPI002478B49D|nr:akirin [Toxorhynchites rutilus septentrionalis]XP_055621514.1 akirin [Toxorhynchites rutilus septentrionalis]XP_055621515.1 akirin [Toxorhynchites rutilus septentrionalis]XP_055621516.1 akirin [Toxorhynchites rutilus septentrionalis]